MKKTYMIPTLQVVKIQTAQLLIASPGFDPNSSTTTMDAREATFSDDEWFEE